MTDHFVLPPALAGDTTSLSKGALKDIAKLRGAKPFQWCLQAGAAWFVIGLSIWVASIFDNVIVSILAIVLIATRQNVLGLLIHEQTHRCGFTGKYGDWVANAIAGFPLIILSVENYGKVHLAHHRDYFTDGDPDFVRKKGKEWQFPKTARELLPYFIKDLLGLTLVNNIRSKNIEINDVAFARRNPTPIWFKSAYFLTFAIAFTYFGVWKEFLLFWIVPLATVLQAIVRWAAIFEHIYDVPNSSVVETTPIIFPSLLNKILLPNLNFSLHPYHHFFAGVPFCDLDKVHDIFVRDGLVDDEHVFYGYGAFLRYLMTEQNERETPTD